MTNTKASLFRLDIQNGVSQNAGKYKHRGFLQSQSVYSSYHMIQNFGGRKFWRNCLHQKLTDNILVNAQNIQHA